MISTFTFTHWCANCGELYGDGTTGAATTLDRSGRCARCGSSAVDMLVRPAATVEGIASAFLVGERDELEKII